MHVGALRAWGGPPPVGDKALIEGQEEVGGGGLSTIRPRTPPCFGADTMVIGDMGGVEPGCRRSRRVTRHGQRHDRGADAAGPKHSGQFGGAAPTRSGRCSARSPRLHDEHGDVAVAGLRRKEWAGRRHTGDEFRDLGAVLEGCR